MSANVWVNIAFRTDSAMLLDRRLLLLGMGALVSGCASTGGMASRLTGPGTEPGGNRVQTLDRGSFPEIGFSEWSDAEQEYVLYPGDEIEIATPTATELTRTQRIGPDGRVSLPLVGQLMAADAALPAA